jgi:uncharacterized RDD family membrane protein YckC
MEGKFKKVSFKDRGLAFFWDSLVMVGLYFGVFIIGGFLQLNKITSAFAVAVLFALVYSLFRDGKDGESKGKRTLKILVINKSNNERISYLHSFLRQSTSFVSVLALTYVLLELGIQVPPYAIIPALVLIVDIFLIYFSTRGQRIGDLISNTQVVYWDDYREYKRSGEVKLETDSPEGILI